ncbi:MAG TPA: hypothetical protein VNI83_12860, partial [Vicinamibacterales bacterium]|nr:hypothetical protein [Vicinamibacterales bacterium]
AARPAAAPRAPRRTEGPSREAAFTIAVLWAFVLVPLGLAIARRATLYDEIRHLFFIVPPLAVIAAAGWTAAVARVRGGLRAALVAALALGLAEPVVFQVRNHPNQIAYFNAAAGGPRGAFGRFEMDYWGNCVLQAVAWAAARARDEGRPLGVSGNPWHLVQADAGRFPSLYFRLPYRGGYHLDIRLLRGPRDAVLEMARRPDVLHRVTTADGAPLCVVLPGPLEIGRP